MCSIPIKTIFFAQYISTPCFENDWYDNLLKSVEAILKITKLREIIKSFRRIQYNEKYDYSNDHCPSCINEEIKIVMKFYPLDEVRDFWQNKKRLEAFIGKYRNHYKEITQAFVRAFDDIDQIVTPLHLNRKTYEERTFETLRLIYDYNL